MHFRVFLYFNCCESGANEKKEEACSRDVEAITTTFTHCCKESGILMAFKCRKENSALKDCLIHHYQNPGFFEECKQQYIQEKLEYEKTGIPAKHRGQKLPASM
uniref:COX assembly mitochondrial protein n=1 Tax=Oryzias latipes TaxID=8090 RepID=A0A3B3I1V4_ORYLA